MNKHLKLLLATCLSVILLAACADDSNAEPENLIDTANTTEGSWVGYNGDDVADEEMMTSELIPYDPERDYEINRSSYVSYYSGNEFIETVLYGEGLPLTIDANEEADGIKVSFNQYNEDAIQLIEQ